MKFLVNPSKFNEMADYIFKPVLIISMILFAIGILLIVFAINPWASGLCLKLSLENN